MSEQPGPSHPSDQPLEPQDQPVAGGSDDSEPVQGEGDEDSW